MCVCVRGGGYIFLWFAKNIPALPVFSNKNVGPLPPPPAPDVYEEKIYDPLPHLNRSIPTADILIAKNTAASYVLHVWLQS